MIGTNLPRTEGRAKVRGAARYIDDLRIEGALYGVTVRSREPRGRIRGIRYEGDLPWDEVTVVTAADIPGRNVVKLLTDDQPFLADTTINHPEEAVVLLAHPDRGVVERARRAVRIDVEPLPAVFDIEGALAADEVVWGEDNVLKEYWIRKGSVERVFADPNDLLVLEGEYATGAQEQLYIEPQGVIATVGASDGLTVMGSLQCPYYVHKGLVQLLDLEPDLVRVVQATTGGGFGGKEDYPTLLAGHAALLAWKARRPVRMIYDRHEDLVATTKRHPSRTRIRMALTRDGELRAIDMDFVLDGGAYTTLSPVVLSRGAIHAAGPYRCDNTRVRARAVATNTPPQGAFRGFGAPQSIYALERHLDRCAHALDLDPAELRRRNLLRRGETTSTGQVIEEQIDLQALLGQALERSEWQRKREEFAAWNADPANKVKRGVGVSTFLHGSGFTGSGEVFLASIVDVAADAQGKVTVLAASSEIGQGSNTIFTQIVCGALGIPADNVEVAQPDTAKVPDSGPTVASRTTMVVGKLVERAANGIKQQLQEAGLLGEEYSPRDFELACDAWHEGHGELKARAQYEPPPGVVWDEETYQGAAYAAYAWAAYVATVSVDTVTWQARVDDFVALQDIGTVVNPKLAAGQIEGGVAQGIGWALYEDVVWERGRMANGQMTNYAIPTTMDLGEIRTFFEEVPFAYGPGGAKGVGELPMDGPAPAVVNAVEHALGVPVDDIPATPERLMEAWLAAEGGRNDG